MGFFGKLNPFRKKDDFDDLGKDLGLGKDFGKDMGMNDVGTDLGPSPDLGMGLDMPAGQSQGQQPFQKYSSYQPSPSFSAPQYQPPSQGFSGSNDNYINSKNLEVISSKLDALRAALDAMNQRLANIEAIARGEQEEQKRRRYY
jgi:hypothetical protein